MEKGRFNRKTVLTVAVILLIAAAAVCFFVLKYRSPYKKKVVIDFAMGSPVMVQTFDSKYDENVEQNVVDSIKAYDTETFTNKNGTSTVSRLNKGETIGLDDFTSEVIETGKEIYSRTNGKAALTVGALSALWDFDSGENKVPEKKDIEEALKTINDNNIHVGSGADLIVDGSVLDLGSVGKGAACDRAALLLKNSDVENAVVSVGGSVYALGYSKPGQKIHVGVRDPFGTENDYFGYISTSDAFISTSGNYEKCFEKDGKKYHHLLDCTTGYPVEGGLVSVTVVCDSGTKSDALATACFVLGYGDETLSLLKDYNAQAIFVFEDKSVIMTKAIAGSFTLIDKSFTVSKV